MVDLWVAIVAFLGGTVFGGFVVAFVNGILRSAGEDTYKAIKNRVNPPPPEPTEVPAAYTPPGVKGELLSWVIDAKVVDYQADGYSKVVHHETGGHCFRRQVDYRGETKLWLMRKPGA